MTFKAVALIRAHSAGLECLPGCILVIVEQRMVLTLILLWGAIRAPVLVTFGFIEKVPGTGFVLIGFAKNLRLITSSRPIIHKVVLRLFIEIRFCFRRLLSRGLIVLLIDTTLGSLCDRHGETPWQLHRLSCALSGHLLDVSELAEGLVT